MRWKLLLFAGMVLYGAVQHFSHQAITHHPGALVTDSPVQKALSPENVLTINGYRIYPLAEFDLEARVLAVKHYHLGREAELSPVDFALGWGPMSDQSVIDKIDISQSNRFYFWHVDAFPIPRQEIETHSANMHMIPSNSLIVEQLKAIRVGQVVKIDGYLVEAKADDGWHWRSSLTRSDTGKGACEVVLVKNITVN